MATEEVTALAATDDIAEKAELYMSMLDEMDDTRSRIKEFIHGLKNEGHDVKAFKDAINIKRRKNSDEVENRESIRDVYREAIGA